MMLKFRHILTKYAQFLLRHRNNFSISSLKLFETRFFAFGKHMP